MAKQIKPDDFKAPEQDKVTNDENVTTEQDPVTDDQVKGKGKEKEGSLEELVQSQARLIEKLEDRLDKMDNVPAKAPKLSAQEELRLTEEASKSQKQALIEKLDKQPKFAMMIPLGINEKPGGTHEVGINGVVFVYPKGQMISVPETVFKLLSDHFNITNAAGRDMLADRDDRVLEALS